LVSWLWLVPLIVLVIGAMVLAKVSSMVQREVDGLRIALARSARLAVAADELARDIDRVAGTASAQVRR
jgi:cytochrome c-type biogenesis protein CcmH/NrfF